MTQQEIYNKVKAHLLKQGRRSQFAAEEGKSGECAYRGPDGTMCAVGCLIPDEHFDVRLNSEWVGSHYAGHMLENAGVLTMGEYADYSEDAEGGPTLRLLIALQEVHDQNDVKQWPEALAEVAHHFELKP